MALLPRVQLSALLCGVSCVVVGGVVTLETPGFLRVGVGTQQDQTCLQRGTTGAFTGDPMGAVTAVGYGFTDLRI